MIHRLTVDGRDYFLPDPVTDLKAAVLDAIKSGGGYVNIPPLRGGPGIDILFSPGMPVVWTQIASAPKTGPARLRPKGSTETSSQNA